MPSRIIDEREVASNIDLLSAWIQARMAYNGLPGLSIGIVYDQELVWSHGFGYANVERKVPATPRTIYRIASITKLFTSTAILQLRDAGKLQLDDPVTKHVSWFSIRNPYPDSPPITIRHLITHTAGLPREAAFPYWTDADFPTWEQIKATLGRQKIVLPSETQWKYSNLGIALAGEIVAAVSGEGYADYIRQHILDPLGMSSTYVRSPDRNHPQLATGYGRRMPDGSRTVSPFTDGQGLTAACNMSTTVEDLARFAMLQFRDGPVGGQQILRGSTLREMQRVHWLDPNWQVGRGLGFQVMREGDKTYIEHGGAVLGYRTRVQICPADKIGVIVLTNADDGDPPIYAEKAFQWVAPAILKVVTPELEPMTPDPMWQRYVGKYRDAWGDTQVLIYNGNLVMIEPSTPDPKLTMSTLIPVTEHTFRIESKDGFTARGELAVFELDEEGRVQRVKIGENYIRTVSRW